MTYLEELARAINNALPEAVIPDPDISELLLTYAVLALAKGANVSREDVHNAWVAWMVTRGKSHPSMVPFDELSPETQAEDSPFVAAIRTVATSRLGMRFGLVRDAE